MTGFSQAERAYVVHAAMTAGPGVGPKFRTLVEYGVGHEPALLEALRLEAVRPEEAVARIDEGGAR